DFAIDRSLFGVSAFAFHTSNVLWHIAATLALRWLLRAVTTERVAFAAALLFALHPLHTEAVTGVIGRAELMAALFFFVGCRLHLGGRAWLAAAAYFCALASKESGLTLPLVAIVLDARTRRLPEAIRRAWPFAVALTLYLALRVHALAGAMLPSPAEYFVVASRWQAMVTAVDVLGRDLGLLVWPHPLSADYSYPSLPIASASRALASAGVLALLALSAWRWRALRLPVVWFALTILPVSNLVLRIGVLMAERLLYLPSVSVCLAAALAYDALSARARPWIARAALASVALSFAALTMARNVDWQTPLSLWRDTVDKQPQSGLAHANLALSCATVGDDACARAELERAVALNPLRSDFRMALERLP
ncbi:MAG: repeat-containing protein, partial [bacterium]|nr:repeat-containing protein [bacterium]